MDHYIVRDYQVDFFLLFLPKGPDDKENESILKAQLMQQELAITMRIEKVLVFHLAALISSI